MQEFSRVFDDILDPKNKQKSEELLRNPQVSIPRGVPSEMIHYVKAMGLFLYQKPDVHKEFGIKLETK